DDSRLPPQQRLACLLLGDVGEDVVVRVVDETPQARSELPQHRPLLGARAENEPDVLADLVVAGRHRDPARLLVDAEREREPADVVERAHVSFPFAVCGYWALPTVTTTPVTAAPRV